MVYTTPQKITYKFVLFLGGGVIACVPNIHAQRLIRTAPFPMFFQAVRAELPDVAHPLPQLNFDLDRATPQISGLQFLAEVLQLCVSWKGDDDHDDWNQEKRALQWSDWYPWKYIALLAPAMTVHKGPFGSGGHHTTFVEAMESWVEQGVDGKWWRHDEEDIAADLGVAAPRDRDESLSLMKRVVAVMKGGDTRPETLKMSRWFSSLKCFKQMQPIWTATKSILCHYHEFILGKSVADLGEPDPEIVETLGQSLANIKLEIKRMRDKGLNSLSLAIPLMTSENRRHSWIICTVSEPLWHWGGLRAQDKKTPEDNVVYIRKFYKDWQVVPRNIVNNALYSMESHRRMGLHDAGLDSDLAKDISWKIFDLQAHLVQYKALSYAKEVFLPTHHHPHKKKATKQQKHNKTHTHTHKHSQTPQTEQAKNAEDKHNRATSTQKHNKHTAGTHTKRKTKTSKQKKQVFLPPSSFGHLLSEDPEVLRDRLESFRAQWRSVLIAEQRALSRPVWATFMRKLRFLKYPNVRLTYMLVDDEDGIGPRSREWLEDMFTRKGDSRLIENIIHDIRTVVNAQASNTLSSRALLTVATLTAPALDRAYGDRLLRTNEATIESLCIDDLEFWKKRKFMSRRDQLPAQFSTIMLPHSHIDWKSSSHESDNDTLLQWLWFLEWERLSADDPNIQIGDSWPSRLMPVHALAHCLENDKWLYCLWSNSFGSMALSVNQVANMFLDDFLYFVGRSDDVVFIEALRPIEVVSL